MPLSLTPFQQLVFDQIIQFLKTDSHRAFVLKGYAGTGKTFLMQQLASHLSKPGSEQPFQLLATTGRAAAVLRGKTGFESKTVHSALYTFSKVEGDSEDIADEANIDQFGQMALRFDIRVKGDESVIYIIDEASMLSSEVSDKPSFAQFGSGRLLIDLLEAIPKGKFIFVGDPCQLPPVGQDFSPALTSDWLEQQGVATQEAELSEILRTDKDNDILVVAGHVRRMLENRDEIIPKWPKIPALRRHNVTVCPTEEQLFETYWQGVQQGTNSIAIAMSNAQCYKINERIRALKFGVDHAPLQVGDRLLVTQNNYIVPLTNGDFVEVTAIGERRHHCNLMFTSIRVRNELTDTVHEVLFIEDLLHRRATNITPENHRELMIAYSRECRQKGIKPNSQAYKDGMMKDPYLNALRATFGYAVTCHKAQGGEWDHVFLFLQKSMYGMLRPDLFRWWYTAITRARQHVCLHNDWWLA